MKENIFIVVWGIFSMMTSCIFESKNDSCITPESYQKVYDWIVEKKAKNTFFAYDGYEIYPEKDRLKFEYKKSLMGGITKEKGVYSVYIGAVDYGRAVRKIEQVFCKILKEIQ
jgi:membrane-anchored protein YejM (alkaline phosphatase superfamily)